MKSFPLSHPCSTGIRLILLLAVLLLSFGSAGTQVAYAAPPAHDDFDAAKTIDNIEYHDTVDTTEATPSDTVPNVDDPDHFPCDGVDHHYGFASVWYKYTPPEDQSLGLNAIGTDYDTFIAVWTGTRGNLTLKACNDETLAGPSELFFDATGGTTYYIEIAQYNDGKGTTDNIGGTLIFNAYITNTTVRIGGVARGRYFVPETTGLRRGFIKLTAGPVEIFNVAGNQLVASERVIYKVNGVDTSFSELMGLPANQVDKVYWMPWYNSRTLNTQLRIGNISNTTATVRVYIGGRQMPGSPYTLAAGASLRKTYPDLNTGPVKIASTVPIVAAERVIYRVNGVDTSFTEMMGMPHTRLETIYWLPWYNSKSLVSELRIANASQSAATVRVVIGGIAVPGSPFFIAPGKTIRKSFPGIDKGPVQIVSNVKIVASQSMIYKVSGIPVSFSELMALPNKQGDTVYWMPWYTKNRIVETKLQFANVTATPATVRVYIGGQEMVGSPFTLGPRASVRKVFSGIDRGPVRIQSNVRIIVSARVVYIVNGKPTSYSEMMALPNKLLAARYWMPWYNNLELNTQLRFALP